jgi:hypothetical protein
MGNDASDLLLAKVRVRYALSLGQVSEIVNVLRSTLCSVAAGTRVLSKAKLLPKQERIDMQLQQMEEAFGQAMRAREMYSKMCDVIEQTDLAPRFWQASKKYSLVKDIRLNKVDIDRIVVLEAKLAAMDAQIQVLKVALANKRLRLSSR